MFYYIAFGLLASVILYFLLNKKTGQTNSQTKLIYIIGEKGAGKTKLLYYLSKQPNIQTTNSIEPNQTILESSNNKIPLIDVPGNNYQKEQFFAKLDEVKKIVLVIDASSISQISPSAELLYNILISNTYQRSRIPILIALNKQDLEKAYKSVDFEQFLQREMEKIKRSRKAIQDQRENSTDKLRFQEQAFTLEDYNQIKVGEISVKNGQIDCVQKFIFQ